MLIWLLTFGNSGVTFWVFTPKWITILSVVQNLAGIGQKVQLCTLQNSRSSSCQQPPHSASQFLWEPYMPTLFHSCSRFFSFQQSNACVFFSWLHLSTESDSRTPPPHFVLRINQPSIEDHCAYSHKYILYWRQWQLTIIDFATSKCCITSRFGKPYNWPVFVQ